MMMREVAKSLLANKVYDIEFHGYLSNHAKHAVVALERLRAPESRVQAYWDDYTSMTPYNLPLHEVEQDWDAVEPANQRQWEQWKGKKIHWQQQVAFMNRELHDKFNNDTNELVKAYAPPLLPGMAGALTHGIIHLGWAIDAQSPWMITEGLAYLNFAYLGLQEDGATSKSILSDRAHVEREPMDSYLRVADTFHKENLQETWVNRVKAAYDESFHPELVPAGFQWHLSKALHEPHPIATGLPTWLNDQPLKKVWEDLYKAVTLLYLATRSPEGNGNFIVLHLLTSLWGLEHTIRALEPHEELEREILAQFYAVSVVLFCMSSSGFPSFESLAKVKHEYSTNDIISTPEKNNWNEIISDGIAETEEHNIKLVYVARELWNRYNHWNGFHDAAASFTITPNIGPSSFKG